MSGNIERHTRGSAFSENLPYLRLKKGENGIKILNNYIKKQGATIDLLSIKDMNWYPISDRICFFEGLISVLGMEEKHLLEMGRKAPNVNSGVKFFLKFIISPRAAFDSVAKYWGNYYDFGTAESIEFLEDRATGKGHALLRMKEADIHPLFCIHQRGFIEGVARLTKAKNPVVTEKVCIHRGGPYCDFSIDWDLK